MDDESPTDSPSPSPSPPPTEDPEDASGPCQVDADCGAGMLCSLRICVAGCTDATGCGSGEMCDAHGRCHVDEEEPTPNTAGVAELGEHDAVLALGDVEARAVLRNTGDAELKYRVAATNPAITVDSTPGVVTPGAEIELLALIDRAALMPTDHALPIQIITSGGLVHWSLEIEGPPEPGHFRGSVMFESGGVSLASSAVAMDLEFRDDGTVVGRVDPEASFLWPLPFSMAGTWTADGGVSLVLRDQLAAEDWRMSPLARPLVREFVLAGERSSAGIEGTLMMALTGLRDGPVKAEGAFVLRRVGPPSGLAYAPGDLPDDAAAPTWLAPPGLDVDACAGLGEGYGTDLTLTEPEPACDACAGGACSPDDMMECAVALRDAAYQLPEVLAALNGGGEVKPPAGTWTWQDCTADAPSYTDDGETCLDIAALRCGNALHRRGSEQTDGPWGEALRQAAAMFASDEASAAMLLSIEAQIDAAFAYTDELGEPVSDVMARELAILAADRERLAAALAPTLAPAYAAGLQWVHEQNPDYAIEAATRAPLRLLLDFADTTAAWASLAYRADSHPDDLRAAVRLAAITTHAAGLELAVRLADDPAAAPDLHALGPALERLIKAYGALTLDSSPFGYPAAYVPLALGPQDIEQGRTNFEAVLALAADDLGVYEQIVTDAWQRAREYEEKSHTLESTLLQIDAEYDAKLRDLCGSLPGETTPALATCGDAGGRLAELRAAIDAAGLRIQHAAQAAENNVHSVAVEEERFGKEVALALNLEAEIEAAQGRIFQVKDQYGEQRSALGQAEAMAECSRVRENARAEESTLTASCNAEYAQKMFSGPSILGVSTPDIAGLVLATKECDAKRTNLNTSTDNQCESLLGQAGLQNAQDELQRSEDEEILTINAEVDQAIRTSDLESRRASSVALIKNLRAEGLLLQIEQQEAELARGTAVTTLWSAYQEVAALAQEKARAVGQLADDSPDNTLTRPHFLQARLEAARRVLPARERTTRRVYLALRALEYEVGQELPDLRDDLARARSAGDFTALLACLDSIAEDYRLEHGHGQTYITEVSLRADVFAMITDVPDVDGTPATPAEQFAALLQDPLHHLPDGSVALPFSLSAFEHAVFSSLLCDDRVDSIEAKLVGDFLGDREAEIMLTRQGQAGVRRCDGADLPSWSAYVPYTFDRAQVVIQAGVNEWGTAGPNAGYAAWPVHGEQWTLTIPPPEQSPANADLDLGHISDVVLRLHHRAGTIAPEGQGAFTPSCGG